MQNNKFQSLSKIAEKVSAHIKPSLNSKTQQSFCLSREFCSFFSPFHFGEILLSESIPHLLSNKRARKTETYVVGKPPQFCSSGVYF